MFCTIFESAIIANGPKKKLHSRFDLIKLVQKEVRELGLSARMKVEVMHPSSVSKRQAMCTAPAFKRSYPISSIL